MSAGTWFEHRLRVYYEDTDCGGVVYYANYLKFLERGRTEALHALGLTLNGLEGRGLVFVVHRIEVDYLRSAKLEDDLIVRSRCRVEGRLRLRFEQEIQRGDEVLIRAQVRLATVDPQTLKPTRIPPDIMAILGAGAPIDP
ncbi:MAG: tol-pal system-associated acyl-CoA thioesterase [Alphaproteobacteria bacterium CG_4_10_14_0_2_um_filter_63_37]|nr:MAG: tol-pal system-associated acyl-CoA thioesterase [Proteobacteria bacterium CG1_02_64_396]PJA23512.1 MAG: tol-pal system-associated acyl-CoA thioesterase [Alphaproteobacteria bacterium CG_4_10_14_0_2_um_filter_63_37]